MERPLDAGTAPRLWELHRAFLCFFWVPLCPAFVIRSTYLSPSPDYATIWQHIIQLGVERHIQELEDQLAEAQQRIVEFEGRLGMSLGIISRQSEYTCLRRACN